MKPTVLIFAFFTLLSSLLVAQTEVILQIDHKLKDMDFAFNTATTNNIGDPFLVTRMEYYISGISLLHDGGMETPIEDLYILVNANARTSVSLGEHDIQLLEAIRFHIGVDSAHNHLDPALWPSGHPLAPQFPSMHWGWTSGYRFLAMEGFGGNNYNQLFQLHALGNDSYLRTEISFPQAAVDGLIKVSLFADYTRVLEDIGVAGGIIIHGENFQTLNSLENCRDFVFSPNLTTATHEVLDGHYNLSVFPNPQQAGQTAQVRIEGIAGERYQVICHDAMGRSVLPATSCHNGQQISLQLPVAGVYTISLHSDRGQLATQRVIVY
ncbi:MAG: MbnP family protein [Saprospiraceae bacterium]